MLLLIPVSCSSRLKPSELPPREDVSAPKPVQTLVASTYGEEFQNKLTASGEIFDPNALTAAHKTYRFGTMLRVTNPKNGKSVVVRVNDRGPFKKGRALDLSTRAAKELAIIEQGVAPLEIEVLSTGD